METSITPNKNTLNPISSPEEDYPPLESYPYEDGRFERLFENKERIGGGAFGDVYKAKHKLDKGEYAIKRVKIRQPDPAKARRTVAKALREVSAMMRLNHPGIVRYLTCWIEKDSLIESDSEDNTNSDQKDSSSQAESSNIIKLDSSAVKQFQNNSTPEIPSFETENSAFGFDRGEIQNEHENLSSEDKPQKEAQKEKLSNENKISLYMQLEFCAGQTLRDYVQVKNQESTAEILGIFLKILSGVNVFHKAQIIHRDLKPENIFFSEDGNIKIGDFGLAVNYFDNMKDPKILMKQVIDKQNLTKLVGTFLYMSPEMKGQNSAYDMKTDIYALGIILYEMLSRFKTQMERGESLADLIDKRKLTNDFLKKFPQESELILLMTSMKPQDRPNGNWLVTEIVKIKDIRKNEGYKEEQATIVAYEIHIMNKKEQIKFILVESKRGKFHIRQGFYEDLVNNPPKVGQILVFKYVDVDKKNLPLNPIFKSFIKKNS